MNDRGMVKWLPFDSVTNTNKLVNELSKNKEKINIPILSEEQIINIEKIIFKAYQLKYDVVVKYYNDGFVVEKVSVIKKLDLIKKRIIFVDNSNISFNVIIDIRFNYFEEHMQNYY